MTKKILNINIKLNILDGIWIITNDIRVDQAYSSSELEHIAILVLLD